MTINIDFEWWIPAIITLASLLAASVMSAVDRFFGGIGKAGTFCLALVVSVVAWAAHSAQETQPLGIAAAIAALIGAGLIFWTFLNPKFRRAEAYDAAGYLLFGAISLCISAVCVLLEWAL
jgi:hypothetical protein